MKQTKWCSSKNDVVEEDVYNAKVKNIADKIPDITNLAVNTTLNAKINEVKNEIPSITNLATTAALNAKINKFENETPSITNLATTSTTALTAVENKIPYYSKYITTPEFNKLRAENFTERLNLANFATKGDIVDFTKNKHFHDKLNK